MQILSTHSLRVLGVHSCVLVLLLAGAPARAQDSEVPARGGVGVVRGEVGVRRTVVDERSPCAIDRLVGTRPQAGVGRDPVGIQRSSDADATSLSDGVPEEPCRSDTRASPPGLLSRMVGAVTAGLRSLLP